MHIWGHITYTVLAAIHLVAAAQVVLTPARPHTLSSTLVDVLSNDSDYTSLIRLLQRTRLIPTLNRLNGSTLFAPTNDAIRRRANHDEFWHSALTDDAFLHRDNVQEKLRQELFYHLLDYTLSAYPSEEHPDIHKTLLFPRQPTEPPSKEPPPSPPWKPIPGGTLGGEPQRLRVASRDGSVWVGANAFGDGGTKLVKDRIDAANGVVLAVADVLTVPADLATVIAKQDSLSYFNRIMTTQLARLLNDTAGMTLFLPVDSAWDALHPIERLYLESDFAADDLHKILTFHAVLQEKVIWSDLFAPARNVTTVEGQELEIIVSGGQTTVSSSELVEPDIYASNGVLHTVSSLLLPPGALQLTPEKFLLALNCTTFVSYLHSVNLTSLINDTEAQITILAPRDDVLSVFSDGDLPEKGSKALKALLQYHFIPGHWTSKKLKDGMLVETALEEPGLDGNRQVLDVEVTEEEKKKGEVDRRITFGGASVIGEPVLINNTVIYFISRPLLPPIDHLQTALPKLELSMFLAAVFSTRLADELKTRPRTSLLIPRNSAFKRLGGLVSDHLLRAASRADLEHVILHHTLDGVEYTSSLVNGSARTYPTVEGSDVHVERSSDGSVSLSGSGGWAGMVSELSPLNVLTQTGVIHEVSDVMIPRSVDINIGKLVRAAKATTMLSLATKAGFEWVLNGTAPPHDSPWADAGVTGVGWTLLCPTDDAFKTLNLSSLYADIGRLREIVSQHLIPTPPSSPTTDSPAIGILEAVNNNNRPLAFGDHASYNTLRSNVSEYGDIIFRPGAGDDKGTFLVGIKEARGGDVNEHSARVISWGRATAGAGTGGVILIDGLLVPFRPSWWREYGAPLAVGVIGVLVILAFFYGVRAVWRRDTTEATYEPIGSGFVDEDA